MIPTIELLGSFKARAGTGKAITLPTRKTEALLALLALSPEGRQSRDRLLDLLWGSRAESKARQSLSQTLTALRSLFGKDAVAADRDTVALVRGRFEIDVTRFLGAAESEAVAELRQAAALYRGPLLDGLMVREAAFQEWIGHERRRFAALGVDVLIRLGRALAQHQDDRGAVRALETALKIDPLADAAHAALLQFHLDRGRPVLVARHYADCVELYRRELDTAPGAEIDRVAREAAARRTPDTSARIHTEPARPFRVADRDPIPAEPDRSPAGDAGNELQPPQRIGRRRYPSLVVLPFRNLSAGRECNFVDGIDDDITLSLCRLKEFRVIGRLSAGDHRGRVLDIRRSGIDVGATYVVEGSVRCRGPEQRVLVRVVNAETRTLLWCERFEGRIADDFGLQDGVVNRVASGIHNAVRHAEIALVHDKPPARHDAYDLVLQAYPLLWSQDRIKNRAAIRLLRQSVALDRDYGRAHALLAWCLTQEIVYFWSTDPDRDREAALLAVEAAGICIDDDPTAMAAIGAALSQCGDQVRAAAWLERALSLDPSNAWAWGRYGHVALYSDDPAKAKQRFQRSLDVSPYDPFAFNMRMGIAQALGMEGAYHEAIAITRDVLNKHPNVTWANRTLGSYSALTGDTASAQAALRQLVAATPNLSVRAMKHTHPMRHIPRYYETLVEGLERSGLPRK